MTLQWRTLEATASMASMVSLVTEPGNLFVTGGFPVMVPWIGPMNLGK